MRVSKIVALLLMVLIVTTPIAIAEDLDWEEIEEEQEFDDQDTGESIYMRVSSYEPTILTSNLVEDNDVKVYAFLSGFTLGTLIGSDSNVEPSFGNIEIESVKVKPANVETRDYVKGYKYIKPNLVEMDSFLSSDGISDMGTLGYLVLTLKQIEKEEDIPDEFNLSFTGEIYFSEAERLYYLAQSSLVLPEDDDYEQWEDGLDEFGSNYWFFGGRGLIRARNVADNSVDLTVYSNKDLFFPILGSPRAIADVSLSVGEESQYFDLGDLEEATLRNAEFRIRLDKVDDPQPQRAKVEVNVDGTQYVTYVTEGMSLYPGSTWTVKNFYETRGGDVDSFVFQMRDTKGNQREIVTYYGDDDKGPLVNKQFMKLGTAGADDYSYNPAEAKLDSVSVSDIDRVFSEYGVALDVSRVSSYADPTNEYTLSDGDTLKEVLADVLPAGFMYVYEDGTLYIEKLGSSDLCNEVGFYDLKGKTEFTDAEKKSNTVKRQLICNAVEQYKVVVEDYGEELTTEGGVEDTYENIGESRMGDLYVELAKSYNTQTEKRLAKEKAMYYYERVIERESPLADAIFVSKYKVIYDEVYDNFVYGDATVEDSGRSVYVKLLEVVQTPEEDMTSITMTVDGVTDTYYLNDYIYAESIDEGSYKVNWKISSVSEDYVRVSKEYVGNRPSGYSTETETLTEGYSQTLSGDVVKLNDISFKRVAYLTILPGSGENLYSKSNFSVHIPVEKRAFDLNPDKIDNKIENYKKLHEKLERHSEWLNGVVEKWIKVCYGTFAVVTLWNSLRKSSSFASRDFAINGYDDDGWSAYCSDSKNWGTDYNSYDSCMLGHAADIQKDMDAYSDAMAADAEHTGEYDWEDDLAGKYEFDNLEECEKYLDDPVLMDDASKSSYNVYHLYKESGEGSDVGQDNVDDYMDDVTKAYGSIDLQDRADACNDASEHIDSYSGSSYTEDDRVAAFESIYDANLVGSVGSSVDLSDYDSLKQIANFEEKRDADRSVYAVGKVYSSNSNLFVYSVDEKRDVVEMEYSNLQKYLEKFVADNSAEITGDEDLEDIRKTAFAEAEDEIELIKKSIEKSPNYAELQVSTKSGKVLYYSAAHFEVYVGDLAYDPGVLRDDFASDATIELDSDGKPYCLPYKDGEFIKIHEYNKVNEVSNFDVWNVGSDGHLCTTDDVRIYSQSVLDMNNQLYTTYSSYANSMVKKSGQFDEGECYPMLDMCFTVTNGKSHVDGSGAVVGCYEVMDPKSCKMLFTVCDPVMCPPSRFNLGGRWNVDSVVETGLIGSIVLPQKSGDPLPVCLTGVNAALNSWESQVEAMIECLETAKYDGEYVGICDAIRSVYWCELAVKELVAIIDSNGGALSFLNGKLNENRAEKGGGEYFSFEESMQNMKDSVNYFTSEYSTSAFAAFRGRSLTEVGSEICRSAIYSKVPAFGDFMDQISQPEDPTTFTAHLTVRPYAETVNQEAYQSFYHIYAGLNENIDRVAYSVYLKNSNTGDIYPVTGECGHSGGTIEQGGYVDATIDCVADEGMDQICVMVNGETSCGFGSVSTSFIHDKVEEMLVMDEVDRNITSEKDCYPEYTTMTPSLSSIGTLGISDAGILPKDYGMLSTGIKRVCSTDDPGKGTLEGSWSKVGTCGYDDEERFLGYCWLDEDSLTIYDAVNQEEVSAYLDDLDWDITKIGLGLDEYLDEDESKEWYDGYYVGAHKYISDTVEGGTTGDDMCNSIILSIGEWEDFEELTFEYSYSALARLRRAEMVGLLRKGCGVEGREGIDYEITIDGVDVTNNGPNFVYEAGTDFTFKVTLADLTDDDTVYFDGENVVRSYVENGWTYNFDGTEDTVDFEIRDFQGEVILSTSFTFTSNEEEQRQMCAACDDGVAGKGCKEETCHSMDYCYLDGLVSYDVNWFGSYTLSTAAVNTYKCNSCYDAKECEDYTDDISMCNSISCTSKADLDCYYSEVDKRCMAGDLDDTPDVVVTDYSLSSLMQALNDDGTEFVDRKCNCGSYCNEYAEWIMQYSAEYIIDEPLLLLSIMMQESHCEAEPTMYGSGNAGVGLMQIESYEICKDELEIDSLDDLKGTSNVEKNIACGAIVLKEKYDIVQASGGSMKYEVNGETYYGWDGALRGYNGWGKGGDDDYVEKVNERVDSFKGMMGYQEDSSSIEKGIVERVSQEYQYLNGLDENSKEGCEYLTSYYDVEYSVGCESVDASVAVPDWSLNFIEYILDDTNLEYIKGRSQLEFFDDNTGSTKDCLSYDFVSNSDYSESDLLCKADDLSDPTKLACYFITDITSGSVTIVGYSGGKLELFSVLEADVESDYYGYISCKGQFSLTDNEQRLEDAIGALGGGVPDTTVYTPSCCGAWTSGIYKYMGYNYAYYSQYVVDYDSVQEMLNAGYEAPIAFNIGDDHSYILVAVGDDAQRWLDLFTDIHLRNSAGTELTGTKRKVDSDEVLLVSYSGNSQWNVYYRVISKTADPGDGIERVFPLTENTKLCEYDYQKCPDEGKVGGFNCDKDSDYYWTGDGSGSGGEPDKSWSRFWEPDSEYYKDEKTCEVNK
jgi:hypothetical protein